MHVDPHRILQPLGEIGTRLENAGEHEADRAAAVGSATAAIEHALRLLSRSAGAAPEADPDLPAATILPRDRLLEELRRRELVSIELAGMAHELFRADDRGEVVRSRAVDLARAVVARVHAEVVALGERPVRDAAHHAVAAKALDPTPREVRLVAAWRPLTLGGSVVALLAVIAFIAIILVGRGPALTEPVAHFRAGALAEAEAGFLEVIGRHPDNVTARLYLGRIYRRQERFGDAADVLREARDLDPRDPDVRRELGHLLMNLDRVPAAVEQYRIAVEIEPDRAVNWIGLIRAMRAAGDPRAEDMLRRAPAEARAVLAEDS